MPINLPPLSRPTPDRFAKGLPAVPDGASTDELKSLVDANWGTITRGRSAQISGDEAQWLFAVMNQDAGAAEYVANRIESEGVGLTSRAERLGFDAVLSAVAQAPANPGGTIVPPPSIQPVQPAPVGGTTPVTVQGGLQWERELPASKFTANLDALGSTFGRDFGSVAEMYQTITPLPNGTNLVSNSHMVGQKEGDLRLISYNDADGPKQADIARFMKPGEIMIAIKHHSPKPDTVEKERIKLQCTHIEIAVGVKNDDGSDGAITLNNPQNYQNGLFGDESYPMIFVKPTFPSDVSNEDQLAYVDNIRTWLTIANTYTNFPGDYNGGDPLATRDAEQVRALGDKLIEAMTGTPDEQAAAKAWLSDSANEVYCAELAHVALNLGIHMPLNAETLGADRAAKVKEAITDGSFVSDNDNEYAPMVKLNMAPAGLKPLAAASNEVAESPVSGTKAFGQGLAIKPFTIADMVEEFLQNSVPREQMGEAVGPVQAKMLEAATPGLLEATGLDALPDTDPNKQGALALLGMIGQTVAKDHGSYGNFRAAVAPLMVQARGLTGPRGDGTGAFAPPHMYLVRATEEAEGKPQTGALGFQYVGHGVHANHLDPA